MQQYNWLLIDLRCDYLVRQVKFIVENHRSFDLTTPEPSVHKVRMEFFVSGNWFVYGVFDLLQSRTCVEFQDHKTVEFDVLFYASRVRFFVLEHSERIEMSVDVKVHLDEKVVTAEEIGNAWLKFKTNAAQSNLEPLTSVFNTQEPLSRMPSTLISSTD